MHAPPQRPPETGESDDVAPVALHSPRDGVPAIVTDPAALAEAVAAIAAGRGPVALDAERASGYRYGQRAYLIQLRRESAGTVLIDPIAVADLSPLQAVLANQEWILHAASQDLPCLAEVGLRPGSLFDTELAGRLLGRDRVGLGPLVERELGFTLEKGHAAADWSTRPLPEPWLRYAALDVELLIPLRDRLADELVAQGKWDWAQQEFEAIISAPPPQPRPEPWRRTSGINRVRQRRALAVVRALWQARDEQARRSDISPGRVLPDAAIIAAALASIDGPQTLRTVAGFTGRGQQRRIGMWWQAIAAARALPDSDLPAASLPADGPPPARAWRDRDPVAASRLTATRAALAQLAEDVGVPVENLMSPDTVRRVLWSPPTAGNAEAAVAEACRAHGARPWQIDLVAPILTAAIAGDLPAPDSTASTASTASTGGPTGPGSSPPTRRPVPDRPARSAHPD